MNCGCYNWPQLTQNDHSLRHTFGNLVDLRALEAYSLIETARDLFRRQDDGTLISACDLETLVSFLPALQSNIPKDVIYSLVGLSSDSRSSVGIDYSKSNNVVYQDFVEYCVRKSKTLDIVCRPWAPNLPPGEAPAPSWVCQVNKLPFGHRRKNIYGRKSGDVLVGHPHRNYYSAARGSVAMPIFGSPALPDGRVVMDGSMVASGFRVAPVRDLGFRAAAATVHMEWIELSGWRPGAAFVPDHLWRTLVADRGPGGIPTPTWYHRACQYWLDYSEGQDITYDVIQKDQHPATALEYIQRVQSVIWDRTFLKTDRLDDLDRPLYGLGPRETRAGDFICILHGCSVPVVLRRTDGLDEWRLVGECFVYGLMDGEAMDIKAFTDRTQEFLLR